jgi:aspartate/methionine/tyrosine aminotransferase
VRIEPFRMERLQSTYENYVDYNLSESGVRPMRVQELLRERGAVDPFLSTEMGYIQSNGSEELRDRIAAFYPGASRDNVLVTNGGSEANYATFWSLLERGDQVAFMLPNYLQTWGLSRAFASRVETFRLVPTGDGGGARWALDVEGLRRAVTKKTRVILVTHPNNPTGAVLTEKEMDEIVRVARGCGAFIVADEIYRGAEVSGSTTPTFRGRYERVLVTSGLSKAFGLPGLRIGWVVGPPAVVKRLWSYRDYTTIAPGALSDRLARVALEPERREAIFARTRGIIRTNLPVLESWMRAHADVFSYIPPRAGAIVLARYALQPGSVALVEKLRVEKSVLIVPGDHLGAPRHLRLGFGSETRYLREGLARIDEGMTSLARRGRVERAGRSPRPARTAGSVPS